MSYKISTFEVFDKQVKRLAKKYPSLKEDLRKLFQEISLAPKLQTRLYNNVYKARLAIRSKGKGKSGGARTIYYIIDKKNTVIMLTIYDKAEIENVSDDFIASLVEELEELLKKEKL